MVTNYGEGWGGGGGYKTGGGGREGKFYLYKTEGSEEVLTMLKGSYKSFELEVLAILMEGGGGGNKFPTFKRGWGCMKSFTVLKGGGGGVVKRFGPMIFPFCNPPLPVINDRFLRRDVYRDNV